MLMPLQWLVRSLSWFPDALRPGLFLAALLMLGWFVFVQQGLPAVWHFLCRAAAVLIDLIIGLLLLPDYVITTARRRRGEAPGAAILVAGQIAEHALDGAASLYAHHQREPISWKRPPWKTSALIIVACAAAWFAMEQVPPTSETAHALSDLSDPWRDVEDWADVAPTRRVALSPARDPSLPRIRNVERHDKRVGVRLHCFGTNPCEGQIVVRAASGRTLATRSVAIDAGDSPLERFSFAHRRERALEHLHVRVIRD
jgi:hypothetical protein